MLHGMKLCIDVGPIRARGEVRRLLRALPGLALLILLWCGAATSAESPAARTPVLLIGTWPQTSDPGASTSLDAELARQAPSVEALVEALARFEPAAICVALPATKQEWVDAEYERFREGGPPNYELAPEIRRVAFPLAARGKLSRVIAVDVQLPLATEELIDRVSAEGDSTKLDALRFAVQPVLSRAAGLLRESGPSAALRFLNHPRTVERGNQLYLELSTVGAGADGAGAELLAGWYRQNELLFEKIAETAAPSGARTLVFTSAGSLQCLTERLAKDARFERVDPLGYLPK